MARVLIVQGHARSRADTAATLRAEGHEVLEAGSADNGVRLAHEQGPEVILLDPMLPDRSGYELYASLQRDPATLAIPVLFLPGEAPHPAGWATAGAPTADLDLVTRLGMALRTKALSDELRLADVSLRTASPRSTTTAATPSATGCCGRSPACCTSRAAAATPSAASTGEAFLMLLPGTRLDAAWNVAERVRRRTVAVGVILGQDAPRLTASFGVVEHRPADAWSDLLNRAQTALVSAKRAGRNRCEVAQGGGHASGAACRAGPSPQRCSLRAAPGRRPIPATRDT